MILPSQVTTDTGPSNNMNMVHPLIMSYGSQRRIDLTSPGTPLKNYHFLLCILCGPVPSLYPFLCINHMALHEASIHDWREVDECPG